MNGVLYRSTPYICSISMVLLEREIVLICMTCRQLSAMMEIYSTRSGVELQLNQLKQVVVLKGGLACLSCCKNCIFCHPQAYSMTKHRSCTPVKKSHLGMTQLCIHFSCFAVLVMLYLLTLGRRFHAVQSITAVRQVGSGGYCGLGQTSSYGPLVTKSTHSKLNIHSPSTSLGIRPAL